VLPLTKTATWPMCQGMHSPCCAPEPVAGLPRRRLRCPFLRSLGWHYSVCPWGSPWLLWPRAAIWRHLCKSRGSAPFGVWSVTPVCLSLAEAQGEASLRIRRAGSLWIPSSLLFIPGWEMAETSRAQRRVRSVLEGVDLSPKPGPDGPALTAPAGTGWQEEQIRWI